MAEEEIVVQETRPALASEAPGGGGIGGRGFGKAAVKGVLSGLNPLNTLKLLDGVARGEISPVEAATNLIPGKPLASAIKAKQRARIEEGEDIVGKGRIKNAVKGFFSRDDEKPTLLGPRREQEAMGGMMYNKGSLIGKQTELDVDDDGEITGKDFAMLNRTKKQEGSLMMPPEMGSDMPVDTYPNIPPEEMAEAEASQLPDAEMEDQYMNFVLDESLDDDEQSYLMNALETDPKLSQIFDKVITTASEFTGAGEVEGPGTGVSDSIPARLSDGEFVFTKKATDQMGADNLQMMMDDAERAFDGGMMRSPKQEGGMMYKQKDEDPLAYEKIAQDEIKKNMLRANRAPSLLGGN